MAISMGILYPRETSKYSWAFQLAVLYITLSKFAAFLGLRSAYST